MFERRRQAGDQFVVARQILIGDLVDLGVGDGFVGRALRPHGLQPSGAGRHEPDGNPGQQRDTHPRHGGATGASAGIPAKESGSGVSGRRSDDREGD